MKAIRLRLVHKGLILLLVPLVFEIAIAASLICLQHYYGEAVKAEAMRKQIVFHINELWYYNSNFITNHIGATIWTDLPTKRVYADNILQQNRILENLLADDPAQLKRLSEIMGNHARIAEICAKLNSFNSDRGGLGRMLAMRRNLLTCKHLIAADLKSGDLIRAFREYELRASDKAAERVSFIAWLMELVLLSAIIGSVLIAYFLFRYFMQGIHKGVAAMILNIKRFKTGETLAPALAGTDEIALLDVRFHEMAEEITAAQQLKQAFISTVSEQLRVPICAIRDYATMLSAGSDDTLSEVARSRAQKVVLSLDRLVGLMNDLLVLEHPGADSMRIESRQCSLTEVVQRSIDAVAELAEKNNIHLQGPSEQLSAYADSDRLVQVLVNLLSNAIKFSKPGSSVIVSAHLLDGHVEVQVKDTGRGIPSHLKHSIFEKFQQVAATDMTEKGGTGLGLPICKEIIELHGGTIGVDSEEGKGSTFWFRLPVKNAAEV